MADAPKVTPEQVEANIRSEHFFTAFEGVMGERFHHEGKGDDDNDEGAIPSELRLLTICILILQNGFKIIGTSGVASPERFDKELGQKYARENAVSQIWPFMGYELHTQLKIQGEA